MRGPADHSNDGMHTVEAKPLDGGDTASVQVGIDTRPPEVTAVKVAPDRTDGTGAVKLSFTAPAEDGVTVEWAVVDVLGKPVGEQGKPAAPAGAVGVDWTVPAVDGEKLGPGTYWLRVRATDRAGNVTEAPRLSRLRPPGQGAHHHRPARGRQRGGPHLRRRFGPRVAQPDGHALRATAPSAPGSAPG